MQRDNQVEWKDRVTLELEAMKMEVARAKEDIFSKNIVNDETYDPGENEKYYIPDDAKPEIQLTEYLRTAARNHTEAARILNDKFKLDEANEEEIEAAKYRLALAAVEPTGKNAQGQQGIQELKEIVATMAKEDWGKYESFHLSDEAKRLRSGDQSDVDLLQDQSNYLNARRELIARIDSFVNDLEQNSVGQAKEKLGMAN